jgi:CRP-like cAMP-binding protein
MVSPELLRRYPYFAGLTHEQLVALAMTAQEISVDADHRFFSEGDELHAFYLVVEGDVAVVFDVPDRQVKQSVAGQLTGKLVTDDVVISHVGPGEPFGWSAIANEGGATAGAIAQSNAKVIAFSKDKLLEAFQQDPELDRLMLRHVLQSLQQRLHDMRLETMASSS